MPEGYFFSTPSVLASIGLVPLFYGDSLKTLVAKLKDKRTCGFKTEEHKNRFLRTKYVFMYLCQKLKSSLPRVGRVARSAGRVFFSTPSVLSSIGLVPLCYGDSLKLMSKTKKEYVFMFLCLKQKSATTLRSSAQYF